MGPLPKLHASLLFFPLLRPRLISLNLPRIFIYYSLQLPCNGFKNHADIKSNLPSCYTERCRCNKSFGNLVCVVVGRTSIHAKPEKAAVLVAPVVRI